MIQRKTQTANDPPSEQRLGDSGKEKTSCLKTKEGVRVCSKAVREDMQRVSLSIFSIWLKHHQSLGLTLKEQQKLNMYCVEEEKKPFIHIHTTITHF